MLRIYGSLMPLRLLEEIRFWKMQEKEHTEVIRALVSNLEPQYVKLLKEWEPVFEKTEMTATQWIEALIRSPGSLTPHAQAQIQKLVQESLRQSRLFVSQLLHMLYHSQAIAGNPTAQVVVRHIIRESEYFLGVLDAYMSERLPVQPPIVQFPPTAAFQGYQAGMAFTDPTPPSPASQNRSEEDKVQLHWVREADPSLTAAGEGSWSQMIPDLKPVPIGGHVLPPLPYSYDALEPHIDAETMKLHHDIHHKSYVDGLNTAEKNMAKARQTGDFSLIKHWEREAAFNGAGHYLHTIFWNVMTPKGGGKPTGPIAQQINKDFGSFANFKKHFSEAAGKVEGGGWAILVWSPRSHRLEILQAEKHQNLSQWDIVPLLVLDVWEHAYYLKYKTERPKYVDAWWNVVNWNHVNERFEQARKLRWHPY
ncbi:Fe-Mn family superoxide dismutase [Paenibacillus sp. J2TS4]|uniref:Fe-Mn family superoxide dismutase n=1 Tax=Paenibacillus sp. J2TS4 TaxID=2807194 RepID=UPI001B093B38|nr:Fe-Mn family superoxide dismutase [Paenibacillus sp. J2TS4]GIP34733.1 hypothetical protein J2TS4_39430 [Paenibacillus sp. J2TS4]